MSQEHFIGGFHAVQALLTRRAGHVQEIRYDEGRHDKRLQDILAKAAAKGIPATATRRKELDGLLASSQGVVAFLKPDRVSNEADLDDLLVQETAPLLLVLDSVTDPHNLGACLRSANAAGVTAVIVPKDKSAPLNATTRKVASGAAELTPLIRVTNLARTLDHLKSYGIWIVGTCGEAETGLFSQKLTGPLALVMGAEDKGMRRLTRERCDSLVFIPMAGEVSSLNVSVAAGVCLFEAARQRQPD